MTRVSVEDVERVTGGFGFDEVTLTDDFGGIVELSAIETIHAVAGANVLTITTNDIEAIFGGSQSDAVTLTDATGNSLLLDGVEGITGAGGFDEVTLSDTNTAQLGIFGIEFVEVMVMVPTISSVLMLIRRSS